MNKRRIFSFFCLLAIFFIENSVSSFFPARGVFFISALTYYALSEGPGFGALLGAYAGLIAELWGFGPFGCQIASLSIIGALCGFLSRQFFEDSLLTAVLLPISSVYAAAFFNGLILNTASGESAFSALLRAFRIGDLLLAAVVSPFLFSWLKNITPKAVFTRARSYRR